MNIYILYETYSNATEEVVEIVSNNLKNNNQSVTVQRLRDLKDPQSILGHDLVIFATPSWFERGKEGQPHISFLEFMDHMKDVSLKDVKTAFIGLGDSTYGHFCGAIDLLESYCRERESNVVAPTLKLDSFYSNIERETKKLEEWLAQLPLQ